MSMLRCAHMTGLHRRLQVLVDDQRYERLRDVAERTGAPVGELVRRAIDHEFPGHDEARAEAARRLLAAPRPAGREPDWAISKARMLDAP